MIRRKHRAFRSIAAAALIGGLWSCGDKPTPSRTSAQAPSQSPSQAPAQAPPQEEAPAASPIPDPGAASAATAPAAPAANDVRIMKEHWPNGPIKFYNEMRRGANGKWDKNGIGRAYYQSGALEREGNYRDGVRIGIWTYYNPDGSVNRTENRGG